MDKRTKLYFPEKSKNENSSIASLYEARNFYKNYSIPYIINEYAKTRIDDEIDNRAENRDTIDLDSYRENYIPVSDLYNENAFFGLIDLEGDIIVPYQNMNNFKSVGFDKSGNHLYLQNFLADAFNDMVEFLNKQILKNCYALSGIPDDAKNSPFYNLSIKKSYCPSFNIDKLYNSGAHIISSKFKNAVKDNKELNSSIIDYKTFTKKYINFLEQHLVMSPITKSRTTLFYNFNTFGSGLIFSVSDSDPGNDEEKYKKFYIDPAFHNFAKACIKFGFRIDKNNPFILHADLSSPALSPYYAKYNIFGIKDLFNKRYKKVFYEDLISLKYFFVDSYNTFLYKNNTYTPDIRQNCSKNISKQPIQVRLPLNEEEIQQYFSEYPDSFWMRLYIYFKCLELQLEYNQNEFENIVRICNNFIKFNRMSDALKFANSRFNETKGVAYFSSLQNSDSSVQHARSGRPQIKL